MPSARSVVLSCAGFGSRLGLGQTKALLEIHGRPLIHWQLQLLSEIEDIRVVVGYQANDVISEVLKVRRDVIFVYNHAYFETRTGASFHLGARHANEYVIEWDGDLLVHPDDVRMLLDLEGEYVCYSDVTSDEAVRVRLNSAGEVVSFSREQGEYEWTGPACIRREKVSPEFKDVYQQLEPHLPLKGVRIRAYDIDTYDDYRRVLDLVRPWYGS